MNVMNSISSTMANVDTTTASSSSGGGGSCNGNAKAAIPIVVQRALGMHNLLPGAGAHNDDENNVVHGLEGFFLPNYLLLRCGHADNYSKSAALPDGLMRAWEEVRRGPHLKTTSCCSTDGKPISSSKSCSTTNPGGNRTKRVDRSRKRKRKPHHHHHRYLALQDESSKGEPADEIMNTNISSNDGGEEPTNNRIRRRKRKKRRRKTSQGKNVDTDDDMDPSNNIIAGGGGCNNEERDHWINNYQILARVIIAPFTSSLLGVMRRCKKFEEQRIIQHQYDHDGTTSSRLATANNSDDCECITTRPALAQDTSEGGVTSLKPLVEVGATTNNVYQKCRTKKNHFLTLASPQELLETIVDGAICTLVRRTNRFRCQSSSSSSSQFKRNPTRYNPNNTNISSAATVGNVGRRVIHRRRVRKRRGNKEEAPITNTPATTFSTTSEGGYKPAGGVALGPSSVNNNHWLLEENLLSTGYSLGSGDSTFAITRNDANNTSQHTSTNQHQKYHHHHHLRGCPNMAPGIHCIHPNPLSSYGRSSTLMRFLHRVIGDDALREILVNCIVLIPSVSTDVRPTSMTSMKSSSSSSSAASFHHGNYFQLCGPPITMLAKKFDGISKALMAATTTTTTTTATNTTKATGAAINHESRQKKRKRGDVELASTRESDGITNCSMSNAAAKDEKLGAGERWDPNRPIPRGNLFYCDFYNKHVGLSPRHLLNQHEDKSTDGSKWKDARTNSSSVDVKLLNAMTQIWPMTKCGGNKVIVINSNKRRGRWRRLRECGIAMCKEVRRRHQQCNYSRLLEHYCPLPAIDTTSTNDPDGKALLSQHVTLHHTPVGNVVSFVTAILRCAFPSSFWGSLHNFNQVIRTMKVFLNLGRIEQLPEKAIVDGIRVLNMKWLLPNVCKTDQPRRHPKLTLSAHKSITTLVRNVMWWLYCQFIIPVLRSTFYITETEFTGSNVMYYRRPVWTRIKSLSMKLLLKQQYREMSAVKVQKLVSNHNVGCPPAPLRILPKASGIRAIAMLSRSCAVDINPGHISGARNNCLRRKSGPAPNKILQSTFHALKYEFEKRPSLFGAGAFGLTEVFPSFCLFVDALKKRESSLKSTMKGHNCGGGGGRRRTPLYFASADIKHCYDTIHQKRLYELMRSVVDEDVYMTKNNFILHCNNRNRSIRCRWKKRTFSPDQLARFHHAISNDSTNRYFNSIFVEGVHCSIEKKETISGLLRDHIFGQILVANGNRGQRYLLQHSGIPQGSILSSMLCNIYFGNIEEILFDGVFEKGSSHIIRGCSSTDCDAVFVQAKSDIHLLLRIVDDFLLISSSKDTSVRFIKKLNDGIPSLNVNINGDKSRVNYRISLENNNTGKMEEVKACNDFFPWCGLLIDTRTCEISLDYNRFHGSHSIDTVVIHRTGNEGLNLKKKMKDFVRPRCCQRLLFSSDVNRIDMIRLNFYQTFLLCAVKLVHYLSGIGCREASNQQLQFIYDSACDTIHFAFSLISSKIKHGHWRSTSSLSTNLRNFTSFQLTWEDAWWLGRHAFRHVLQRQIKMRRKLAGTQRILCQLFSDCARSSGKGISSASEKELLAVTSRAFRQFPMT